jgi:hypothetical protein
VGLPKGGGALKGASTISWWLKGISEFRDSTSAIIVVAFIDPKALAFTKDLWIRILQCILKYIIIKIIIKTVVRIVIKTMVRMVIKIVIKIKMVVRMVVKIVVKIVMKIVVIKGRFEFLLLPKIELY